ncbi:hypothetical protein BJX76DRAFT_362726 [Aspergillus varians]
MFGWTSEYYPLQGTGSDSVLYPQFVSNDTSHVQPNVGFSSNGSDTHGPQRTAQTSPPTWGRGDESQENNLGQSDQTMASCPSEDNSELEEEAEFFGKILKETRRNNVKVGQNAKQLSDTVEQLNKLRKAVENLSEKVSKLEERRNEDHQSVDSVISTLRSFRGLYHHLVHRLSIPIGLEETETEDSVLNNDNDR